VRIDWLKLVTWMAVLGIGVGFWTAVLAYTFIHEDKPFIAEDRVGVKSDGSCEQYVVDAVVDSFFQYPNGDAFHDENEIVSGYLVFDPSIDQYRAIDYMPVTVKCEDMVTNESNSSLYYINDVFINAEGEQLVLAQTGVSWYVNSKKMAVIEITFSMNLVDRANIRSIALHEVGHAFGLGHSSLSKAIMYPRYTGELNLYADDLGGMAVLYGDCNSLIDNSGNVFLIGTNVRLGTYQAIIPFKGKPFDIKPSQCVPRQ